MSNPAGWYPQPDGQQRYWDGELWTEHAVSGVPAETTIPLSSLKTKHVSKHAAPSRDRRFDVPNTFGWGGLALATLIGAIRSGFSGAAMMLGSFALVVGAIALVRGRVGWARLRSRAAGGVALGGSMIIMTVGALAPPATPGSVTATTPAPSTMSVAGPVATATPTLEPVATATAHGPSPVPTVAASPAGQPAPAPATTAPGDGATALCNDGTLSFKAHNRGVCASHGGVKVFYK